MLARSSGNMADVYAEFWRMQAIADEVEPAINFIVSQSEDVGAEVSPKHKARWYLVHAYPGDDLKALRWLARRRFGVFRPMRQRIDKRNNTPVQGWEAAFPGWLLVYTWDIKKMLRRILSLPGVMGILSDPVSLKPQPIPDWFVTLLQEESWKYKDNAPPAGHQGHTFYQAARNVLRQKKRRRRPGRRIKKGENGTNSQAALTESSPGVT